MFIYRPLLIGSMLLVLNITQLAAKPVHQSFTSSNGVVEVCRALPPIPDGEYKSKDSQSESEYCQYDLYSGNVAMCPKTWSTSPGTIFYSTAGGEFAGRAEAFEQQWCSNTKSRNLPAEKVVKFKTTMNGLKTSATFSPASLLYYHFSRYFDTVVKIPPSVWRSIDRKEHLRRVTRNGVKWSSHSKMINAGWVKMEKAEENPESYRPAGELFSPDRNTIYGILINSPGSRYGVEFNGTRESGWGVGQNLDFQKTPPYLALSSSEPLLEAIASGLSQASKNSKLRKAIGKGFSELQMTFWMQELTEITLLDFIFSQQDRIGNIDYRWYWYWLEGGELKHRLSKSRTVPEELAGFKPQRLKRTWLSDNDAGGRVAYVNFTRKAKMLEKQRHYNPDLYSKLQSLAADFRDQGEVYQYLVSSFGLNTRQLKQIVSNTQTAAEILRGNCVAGQLRFDLDATAFAVSGAAVERRVSCE